MSLKIILGNAGAGKSTALLREVIRHAAAHPEMSHLVLVPEQFCLSTQRRLVEMHPDHVLLNIEALSFDRLAARAFRELRAEAADVLSDTAKTLFLSLAVRDVRSRLEVYQRQTGYPAFVQRLSSLIAEWTMNDIGPERLRELSEEEGLPRLLRLKLKDLALIYEAFRRRLGDKQTAEELLPRFSRLLPRSTVGRADRLYLDGFTGFTTVQYRILEELMRRAGETCAVLTLPPEEDPDAPVREGDLFALSRRTVRRLEHCAREAGQKTEIRYLPEEHPRLPELTYLREHLFRRTPKEEERWPVRPECVHLTACAAPEEEAALTARRILELVRKDGLRWRDIAATVSDLSLYVPLLKRELSERNIPFFTDRREPLQQHPLIRLILDALDTVREGLPREGLLRMLKNPLSPLTREECDRFENYLLAAGVRRGRAFTEPFFRLRRKRAGEDPAQYEENAAAERDEMETLRGRVMAPVIRLRDSLGKGTTAQSGGDALLQFLEDWGLAEKTESLEEARLALGQEGASWPEAADQLRAFIANMQAVLGGTVLGRREFTEMVSAALGGLTCGRLPVSPDQVLVGDVMRSRLGSIKVLFFLGMNEGLVPKQRSGGRLLTDRERLALSFYEEDMGYTDIKAMSEERFYLYCLLQKPAEQIRITYALRGSGAEKDRLPAPMAEEIKALFPELAVGYYLPSARPAAKEDEPDPAPVILSPESVAALYGDLLYTSISGLERFASCPYHFFMEKGLKLEERQEYAWGAAEHGTFFHKVAERILTELKRRDVKPDGLDETEKNDLVDRAMEEAKQMTAGTLEDGAETDYRLDRWKKFFLLYLDYLGEKGLGDGFVPAEFEVRFGPRDGQITRIPLDGGRAVQLNGQIDRIDVRKQEEADYLRIVDYKTKRKPVFKPVELTEGRQLQLAVYLDMALRLYAAQHPDRSVRPGGIGYASLAEPVTKWTALPEERRNALWEQLAPSGLRAQEVTPAETTKTGRLKKTPPDVRSARELELLAEYARDQLARLGRGVFGGDVTPAPWGPKDHGSCTYCDYKETCPFDEERKGCRYRQDSLKPAEAWDVIRGRKQETDAPAEDPEGEEADHGIQ
ncbi:MAG: exodeoxyribonuclease V subunit gamma [Lachnospiraceae bacterium]|nr:exodeoxyribonuclease V subunit gamma [Lachnospiraceae bacterium]